MRTIDEIIRVLGARKDFYEFLSEVYARGVPRKFIEDIKKRGLHTSKNKEQ